MVWSLDHDQVTRYIDAPPDAVYDVVADVTRTPELSPEIVSCEWVDGASGPAVGARFRARNSVGRGPDWSNRPVVTVADRGREFAFSRREKLGGELLWRYVFTPQDGGTLVTESYEVTGKIPWLGRMMIRWGYGMPDRAGVLRRGMAETLDRLAAVMESSGRRAADANKRAGQ
jgi:hypothetical protein